jgi:phosphomannomutase
LPVVGVDDLSVGAGGLPPTDGLRYWLDGTSRGCGKGRVIVRPSGTEPKLKCYLEIVVSVDGLIEEARTLAHEVLTDIGTDVKSALGLV